jgi:hypothetical protein
MKKAIQTLMLAMSGLSAGSSAQQRCISCRSSSSGKTTFSQQGRSCSLGHTGNYIIRNVREKIYIITFLNLTMSLKIKV